MPNSSRQNLKFIIRKDDEKKKKKTSDNNSNDKKTYTFYAEILIVHT